MFIEENLPINYIWFGNIPENAKSNIIQAAFLHINNRKVIFWVSNKNRDNQIEQWKNISNLEVLEIEENLPKEDIEIIHWIFSDLRLSPIERMKCASDYARISVLSKVGGIYLDADIKLLKKIPKIPASKGILFHSEISEKNALFFVENDLYDVIAVPPNSEIIKNIISDLRLEYKPEKNTVYLSGDLVKVNYIISELINNIDDEILKEKLWDAKDYDIGVSISDNYYENVNNFFKSISFPSELFVSAYMNYSH